MKEIFSLTQIKDIERCQAWHTRKIIINCFHGTKWVYPAYKLEGRTIKALLRMEHDPLLSGWFSSRFLPTSIEQVKLIWCVRSVVKSDSCSWCSSSDCIQRTNYKWKSHYSSIHRWIAMGRGPRSWYWSWWSLLMYYRIYGHFSSCWVYSFVEVLNHYARAVLGNVLSATAHRLFTKVWYRRIGLEDDVDGTKVEIRNFNLVPGCVSWKDLCQVHCRISLLLGDRVSEVGNLWNVARRIELDILEMEKKFNREPELILRSEPNFEEDVAEPLERVSSLFGDSDDHY